MVCTEPGNGGSGFLKFLQNGLARDLRHFIVNQCLRETLFWLSALHTTIAVTVDSHLLEGNVLSDKFQNLIVQVVL